MKQKEGKENKKRVNSEVIILQKMPPNVLATHYLRKANNKAFAKKYEESAVLYEQAISYFDIAISKGIVISKSNYTNAICNWVTMLYYNKSYEEALATLTTYILSPDMQYIDLAILLHTQKDLYYNVGLAYIAKGNFVRALENLSISNAISQEVDTLYNMGYIENLQKHFKEAHTYYDQASQLAIKSGKSSLLIGKAIKNNIIEYFIELCHTSNPIEEFESLTGRETTYQELPDSCLKHAKYLLSTSIPISDAQKSITNVNTAALMLNRLAKVYLHLTEEASQQLLSIKLQVSHDYWDLLNTYSYIKTKQSLLPYCKVDESLGDFSAILGSRIELLEEFLSEKPSVRQLLEELIGKRPCELTLEYLSSDSNTIVNLTLDYLGEEDIYNQMAGLIQEKVGIDEWVI